MKQKIDRRHPERRRERQHATKSKDPRICSWQFTLRSVLTTAALATLTIPTLAQTAILPTAPYRIAGAVVSATDGAPIPNAAVFIRLNADDPTVSFKPLTRTATTSDDGRFDFPDLPAGNFTLHATARNFVAADYDEHDGFTTGIVTGSAVPTDSLTFPLTRNASLSGAITNEAAEPVQNASVRLFRPSNSSGDNRIAPAGQQQTDDLGHFFFPLLAPGDYLVAVVAQPWYAVHPQQNPNFANGQVRVPANTPPEQLDLIRASMANAQRFAAFGVTGPLDPSLDVAYPITYYPGGPDEADAQPIPLRPGDSREIALQLSPVPAITLTIPHDPPPQLQPPDPQSPNFNAALAQFTQAQVRQQQSVLQLRSSIFGNIEPALFQGMQPGDNATTFSGLAPGDYIVASAGTPLNQLSGATPIHVAGHSTTAPLPDPSTLAHVHIAIDSAFGAPPASLPIGLIRAGSNEVIIRNILLRNPAARLLPAAAAETPAAAINDTILDIPPGDYSFTVQPGATNANTARSWFLRGIAAGGKPLAANSIHLTANDSPAVTLTIAPGDHTLRGIIVHTASSPQNTDLSPTTTLSSRAQPHSGAVEGPAVATNQTTAPTTNLSSRAQPRSGAVEGPGAGASDFAPAQKNSAVILSEAARQRGESKDPDAAHPAATSNAVLTAKPSQQKPTPAPGVFLLLIPANPLDDGTHRFWRQQSDLDGSFSISGLAPGAYTLFAIDQGWTLNWLAPRALDKYLPAAAHITIPDSTSRTIFLPAPVPAQAK